MKPMQWILSDDTGLSSTAIWAHMLGETPRRGHWGSKADYPHDPDDFGRCFRLLGRFPAWRRRIGEMAQYGGPWERLAPAWDELEQLWIEEVNDSLFRDDIRRGTMAAKLYARMQELIYPERAKKAAADRSPLPNNPPGA